MKSKITGIIMLVAIFAVTAVVSNAQITRQVKTNIPFAFNVGKAELPAGQYIVTYGASSISNSTLIVRSVDGKNNAIAIIGSEVPSNVDEIVSVSFERVDGKYYLGGVSMYALKIDLNSPKTGIPPLKIAAE